MHGSYGGVQTQHRQKLLYWTDHPKVKGGANQDIVGDLHDVIGGPREYIGLAPVPTSPVHGDLPVTRLRGVGTSQEVDRNTFQVPRNFIRLTFRVTRV